MKLQNVKPTKYDNLYTQEEAIKFLCDNIDLSRVRRVWECASGTNNISSYLHKLGLKVTSTDIESGIDFLEHDIEDYDITITNPPYSKKNQFLKRAFELGKPFAMLLPLTTLESAVRNDLFRNKNIQVLIPNKRFDFTGKKNCWFATAWFCWKMDLPEQLNFRKVTTSKTSSKNNSQVKKVEDAALSRLSTGDTKQLGGRHKNQEQMTEVADNQPDIKLNDDKDS